MFVFLKKLLMSRQISFERGEIKIGDDPAIMVSGVAFIHITDSLLRDMGNMGARQIYLSAKEGGKSLGKAFQKRFSVNGSKLAELLKNLAEMGGWGELSFVKIDPKEGTLVCRVNNSPFANLTTLKKQKVCHMTRGLLAGGAAIGFNMDVECIETACKADGARQCEFIVKPSKKFDKKNKIVQEQLFWV